MVSSTHVGAGREESSGSFGKRIVALAIAFVGSGFAGLVVEQGFEKLLGTLLGTSTQAGATVLATYFGGLTLGSWLYGRRRRSSGPAVAFKRYALLEAAIAIACIVLALAFDHLVALFAPLLRLGVDRPALLLVLRLVVSALWILPVTVPMGATFPAVVDALDVVPQARRRSAVSVFYALNLFGAILGAAVGTFFVFPQLGVDGALALGAALDAFAATVAFEASRVAAARFAPTPTERAEGDASFDFGRESPLMVLAFVSGLVLFSLEVVWTQLMCAVIGSTIYAFGVMLAVVLAGLGIGAAISGIIASRLPRVPSYLPGVALVLAACTLAWTHGRWPEAPHALAEVGRDATSFVEAETARAKMAISMLLVPATALGTVYPLLLRLDVVPAAAAGAALARMGGANAVGCIVGALVTGFVGIPHLGSESTLRWLGGLAVVAGGGIIVAFGRAPTRIGATIVVALLATSFAFLPRWNRLALTSGEHVYFRRAFVWPTTKLRFFAEDSAGGMTTVVENAGLGGSTRVLLTNGKFQGNDSGEMAAQDGVSLAPMQFVRDWNSALVIGLGTGRTAFVVSTMGFPDVTIAEISPGIVAAARAELGHINGGILERSDIRLRVDDARNLLLLDDHHYDLVTMEISSVWWAGSTNLYSREFYRQARARLRPGGVLQQWIQLHHLALSDLQTVVASMRSEFPFVALYFLGNQGILVGTSDPQTASAEFFDRLERHAPALGGEGAPTRARSIASGLLLSPSDVDAMIAAAHPTVNDDRNRLLEHTTPKHAFDRSDMLRDNVASLALYTHFTPAPLAPNASGPAALAARSVDAQAIRHTLKLD